MLAKCYAKFDTYNEKTLGLIDPSNNRVSPCMDYTYLATLKSSYWQQQAPLLHPYTWSLK